MAKDRILLCEDSHPEWLNLRHQHVTSSELAALFDAHPYLSRDELVQAKRQPRPPDIKPSRFMAWGTAGQDANAGILCRALAARWRPSRLMVRAPAVRLSATLDGLLVPARGLRRKRTGLCGRVTHEDRFLADLSAVAGQVGLLEMKQVSVPTWSRDRAREKMELWNDPGRPPSHYWWQIQGGLFATGLGYGVLLARLDAADYRGYVVYKDPWMAEQIADAVDGFWKDVSQ